MWNHRENEWFLSECWILTSAITDVKSKHCVAAKLQFMLFFCQCICLLNLQDQINCLVKPPIYKVFVVYFLKTYKYNILLLYMDWGWRCYGIVMVLFWIEIQSNANEGVHFKQKFLVTNCYRLVCSLPSSLIIYFVYCM